MFEELLADLRDPPARRALREIVALRRALDSLEVQLVVAARLHGASWTGLGHDLGLSRQGARQRHLAHDPLRNRSRERDRRRAAATR